MPIEIVFVFGTSLRFLFPNVLSSLHPFLPFFLSMPDASIEILLESLLVRVIRGFKTAFHHPTLEKSWRGCRWVERSRTETTRGITKVTKARRKLLVPGELPNSSTRIVRWVLMDYPLRRKPVNQRKFIVTAFAIDVYSYLGRRLDIDVMSTHAWPIQ